MSILESLPLSMFLELQLLKIIILPGDPMVKNPPRNAIQGKPVQYLIQEDRHAMQ